MGLYRMQLYVFVTVCFFYCIECGPVRNAAAGLDYLLKFNYLEAKDRRTGAMISPPSVLAAVKQFQRSTGLNVTGKLDNATLDMMQKPRCGNPEGVGTGAGGQARRRRRYTLQGSKWPNPPHLTYRITRYTSDLTKEQIDSELARAFKVWSDVSLLTFTPKAYGPVDIEIKFVTGDHGDGNPFDGPSYTLAHAFYPQYGGDAHFDDAETWLFNGGEGVNLFQVASHEFGHAIGLAHSDVPDSLMAPIYRGYVPDFKLHNDDVKAVQILYGKPKVILGRPTVAPTQPPPVKPVGDNPCLDGKVDAMLSSEDGYTYAFRGPYYYFLDPAHGFVFRKPMLIKDGWPGLASDIDGALGNHLGHTYFFKGNQYWKFTRRIPDRRNPMSIKDHWDGIPDNMDAIFKWGGNGKIYAIKGRQYYKQNGGDDYPRPLEVWEGLPRSIDAAMYWPESGYTYFFSGPNYYRFNDKTFTVDNSYPKLNIQWWFDCKKTSGKIKGLQTGASEDGQGEILNVDTAGPWDLAGVTSTKRPDTTPPQMLCDATSTTSSLLITLTSIILVFLETVI